MFIALNKALTASRARIEKNEKGFTLIELLIVVLIIGILAAIAVPLYLGTQASARDNAAKTTVSDAKTAVVAYYTKNGTAPADLAAADFSAGSDLTIKYVVTDAATPAFTICAQYTGGKVYETTATTGTVEGTTC